MVISDFITNFKIKSTTPISTTIEEVTNTTFLNFLSNVEKYMNEL